MNNLYCLPRNMFILEFNIETHCSLHMMTYLTVTVAVLNGTLHYACPTSYVRSLKVHVVNLRGFRHCTGLALKYCQGTRSNWFRWPAFSSCALSPVSRLMIILASPELSLEISHLLLHHRKCSLHRSPVGKIDNTIHNGSPFVGNRHTSHSLWTILRRKQFDEFPVANRSTPFSTRLRQICMPCKIRLPVSQRKFAANSEFATLRKQTEAQ